ncbi:uncharacterized protein [Palaemon carinicauda]|uniref:uncharacterized protein n=1 Tax=Palaemon carinicauda TaxID=392227 RepID=UPI0035B65853
MAESCSVNMEARSPPSTFSTFASKVQSGNYKKIFITAFHEEENLQEQPKPSPPITKPLPPLEPLFDEMVTHNFNPGHPKKRLKREQDDPMLAEAAASPGSCSGAEIRAQFENGRMLSTPNSPFPSLPSPLDTSGLSDSAYFSGLSPFSVFSSPGSVTQGSSPVDIFPSTASSTVTRTSTETTSHVSTVDKVKLETIDQTPCPRPQIKALDLTAMPKQKILPRYAPYPYHPSQPHLTHLPVHHSLPLLLNENQQIPDMRKVFSNACLSPPRGFAHNSHPQVPQQCFDRSPDIISSNAQPKMIYHPNNQQIPGVVSARIHAPHEMGGVIKPKPTHLCKRPFQNPYMQPLGHRRKAPPLHIPTATSSHQDINKNRIGPEAASHFKFLNQSNHFFSPTNHNLSHPVQPQQPSVVFRDSPLGCDASARYEIHYETIDAKPIGLDDGSKRLILGGLPSASGKSFDPMHAPSPAMPFNTDENCSDPDQSSNEEEVKPEPPKKRGPGRPRKPENELKKKRKKTGRLWEFIRNLLLDPETCPSLVRWDDAEQGVFRFVQADKVAQKWGQRKLNGDMNYEKLSRAMRYYYKGGVFEPVLGRRLVYKFGKNAKGWRPQNPNFTNQAPLPPHQSSH